MRNQTATIALLGVCIPSIASADVIGIGLDWRKSVFVQEYWQDGKAFYAIANHNDRDITIDVRAYRGGNKLAGPWKIAAKNTAVFNVEQLRDKDLIRFDLKDGTTLGLLQSPRPPKSGKVVKGIIRTFDGLNGSGGRHENIRVEQSATAYKPGSVVEVSFVIPGSSGVITFSRKKQPQQIEHLQIIDAKSDTLRILSNDEKIEIDPKRATQKQNEHKFVLRLQAPKVESPQMLLIHGWRWTVPGKSGHGITRGVIVDPMLK